MFMADADDREVACPQWTMGLDYIDTVLREIDGIGNVDVGPS